MTSSYLITAMACAIWAQPGSAPDDLIRDFYRREEALHGSGIPDASALKSIAPYLSSSLTKLLQQAKRVEAACIKNTPPGVKPPIWETVIFAGNWEGASGVSDVVIERQSTISATIAASLENTDGSGSGDQRRGAAIWKIDLQLSHTGERWVIDDLQYPDGASLRRNLLSQVKVDCTVR